MKKAKKDRINLYINPRYYKLVQAEAKTKERSASWLVDKILEERYEKGGIDGTEK